SDLQGAPGTVFELGPIHRLGLLRQPRGEQRTVQREVLGRAVQRDPGQVALDGGQCEAQPLQVANQLQAGDVALVVQAQPAAYRRRRDQPHPGVEADRPHADPRALGQLPNRQHVCDSTTVTSVPHRSLDADCGDLGPENSSLHPDCGRGGIKVINLYSDTQTRPVQRMREAMAAAEVGDEQRGEDPTVTALCERVAGLLGKPAAVFLPSGTMCNAIGFRLHIRPGGDAVHLHPTSHPIVAEGGGPSALSGAVLAPVAGEGGMFTAGTLEAALFPAGDRYKPRSRLVSVEQTTNLAGGRVWPLEQMRAVLEVAARHGLRTHLDGARLMNAVVALGVAAADWARGFDTAWIDFTKGLGAPVGAVLAGSTESIGQAWRYKQMMGGSLRQAGIVAAGCLWALDHHVHR